MIKVIGKIGIMKIVGALTLFILLVSVIAGKTQDLPSGKNPECPPGCCSNFPWCQQP